jgi:putative SOS response-associated peptidase YedK
MCGRLTQYRGIHDFVAVLSIPDALINHVGDAPLNRYNAAPTTTLAVLHQHEQRVYADNLRWGWRPHWAKDRPPPINARVEKVAHGPFFRAIWRNRLIVPVDNWFEWVDAGDKNKQPWLIRRADHEPVFCAAIGQFPTPGTDTREDNGLVIITANSVGGMLDIHDRRPVVLRPDLVREWLDPATPVERAEQMLLFEGEPSEVFEWYKVGKAVGNSRNQGAELIEKIA